jgi:uncharacterized protein (UPF0335 family)
MADTVTTDSIVDDVLRNGYDRWLFLENEKAALAEESKELFAELKGQGFDTKVCRASFRRVRNINDAAAQEHDALVDLYVESLTRNTQMRAREIIEQFGSADHSADAGNMVDHDPETGEIAETDEQFSAGVETMRQRAAAEVGAAVLEPIPEAAASGDESAVRPGGTSEVVTPSPDESVIGREASANALPAIHSPVVAVTDKPGVAHQAIPAPPPGVVYMETCPPAPIIYHEFARCWPELFGMRLETFVSNVEANGVQKPIVKIGDQILDGRMRYNSARRLGIEYPVVQYAGVDPLADMVRWNLESGRLLTMAERQAICTKLAKLPGNEHRGSELAEMFGLEMDRRVA